MGEPDKPYLKLATSTPEEIVQENRWRKDEARREREKREAWLIVFCVAAAMVALFGLASVIS